MFDLNNDGRISIDEMKDVRHLSMQILFNGIEDLEEEVVERIITDLDENADRFIDEHEFIKFLNNLAREYDKTIESSLSFLSGDSRSVITQSESPSNKNSDYYKFDKGSITNIQTEASENSASIPKYEAEETRIEIEEKTNDLDKKN